MSEQEKLRQELRSFQGLWVGGFRTGYAKKRNQRRLERYLKRRIKHREYTILEIGCGGGQWSAIIAPHVHHLYCADALSAEHNQFWESLPKAQHERVQYLHVSDFSLSDIPDETIDFVFSYDVFCHISISGQEAYLKTLAAKCKPGAQLCIMYADPLKYLQSEPENRLHLEQSLPDPDPDRVSSLSNEQLIAECLANGDSQPWPGRWYWIGCTRFLTLCEKYGFRVVHADLNIDKTNPITLFQKPPAEKRRFAYLSDWISTRL